MNWSGASLRFVLRLVFRVYFRSVHVRGREAVPRTGPVLIVANHPNSLLDPALLMAVLPRDVRFGARHSLFSTPMGPILRALGAIPIVRVEDDPRAVRKNLEAIEAYIGLLGQGEVTAIFPEGISQDAPKLAPIKGGASRIALTAEGKAEFGLGVVVVPVGLQFEPRRGFRGEAYVRFGKPLHLGGLETLYRERRNAAFRELTSRIRVALGELALQVENDEQVPFVERLTDIYFQHARRVGLGGIGHDFLRGELLYQIASCLNYYAARDPEAVAGVERLLERYERLRAVAGVGSQILEEPSYLTRGPLAAGQASVEVIAGAVPAAFGAVTSAVPFYLTGYLSAGLVRRDRHPAASSFWQVVIGAVLFPAIWAGEIAAVLSWSDSRTAIVFGLTLAPAGLFSRAYLRRVRKLAGHLGGRFGAWMKMDAVARVNVAREELIARMDGVRSRYIAEVFAEPSDSRNN